MIVTLIPLLGPLHLRFPSYNAMTVRDTVRAFQPDALAVTALEPGVLDTPEWQDTEEIVLPQAVIPWAKREKLPLYPVFEKSHDPEATADFARYLQQYPQTRQLFMEVEASLKPLEELLAASLSLKRIQAEVLPLLRTHQELRETHFEDGPGTDWLRKRVNKMAAQICNLPHERVAVLASIDHLPFLEDAFVGAQVGAQRAVPLLIAPPLVTSTEEAETRGFLDFAFRSDSAEPGQVIAKLRAMESAEARYHEANLLLANGHIVEALEVLEAASHGDFSQPYYLPGYLLARLGQLRDLAGERQGALRAYRGVLAFDWVPAAARQAAKTGLAQPFEGEVAL